MVGPTTSCAGRKEAGVFRSRSLRRGIEVRKGAIFCGDKIKLTLVFRIPLSENGVELGFEKGLYFVGTRLN